jgi:hypothetical protein
MTKARLTQLEKRVREYDDSRPGIPIGDKFNEARMRGMILCKDGKERTPAEWLKTLPLELAERIARIGGNADRHE